MRRARLFATGKVVNVFILVTRPYRVRREALLIGRRLSKNKIAKKKKHATLYQIISDSSTNENNANNNKFRRK